jgi:signal peptidase I
MLGAFMPLNFPQQKALPFHDYHFISEHGLQLSWFWIFRQFCSIAAILILGILSYFLVSHFIFQSLKVSGSSMYPALYDNGNYWVNRYVYLKSDPERSDIVEVKDPEDGVLVVKRIIALPGDSICFKNGVVYVNGRRLEESYLPPHTATYVRRMNEDVLIGCGKNQYFVLGDNRGDSADSRIFGTVPRQNILGKVVD